MEKLTWTGSLSFLDPILFALIGAFIVSAIIQIVLSMVPSDEIAGINPDGSAAARGGLYGMVEKATRWLFLGAILVILAYLAIGALTGPMVGIVGAVSNKLLPVWIGMIVIFAASIVLKRRLGLYGRLFNSPIGMVGFAIVLFWVLTAFFADQIITHDPLAQLSGMKNQVPGTPTPDGRGVVFPWRRCAGARCVQPRCDGKPGSSVDCAVCDPVCLHGGYFAGITGRLFRWAV